MKNPAFLSLCVCLHAALLITTTCALPSQPTTHQPSTAKTVATGKVVSPMQENETITELVPLGTELTTILELISTDLPTTMQPECENCTSMAPPANASANSTGTVVPGTTANTTAAPTNNGTTTNVTIPPSEAPGNTTSVPGSTPGTECENCTSVAPATNATTNGTHTDVPGTTAYTTAAPTNNGTRTDAPTAPPSEASGNPTPVPGLSTPPPLVATTKVTSPAKGTSPEGSKTTPAGVTTTSGEPDKPDKTPVKGHSNTAVVVGLVVTALVIILLVGIFIYFRQRRLRNSYGRLNEETEDSGWSAFSKNPIYRGDRDYQLL